MKLTIPIRDYPHRAEIDGMRVDIDVGGEPVAFFLGRGSATDGMYLSHYASGRRVSLEDLAETGRSPQEIVAELVSKYGPEHLKFHFDSCPTLNTP